MGAAATANQPEEMNDRRRADDALRETQQRYHALFRHSPFAVSLVRLPERVVVDVNDAFLALFEVSREEIIGRTSVDLGLTTPEQHDEFATMLRRTGALRDFECRRRTRRGDERILSLHVDQVDLGGVPHLLSTMQDVTARKHAEQELARSDREKSDFLAVLSHELRNPLAPIRNSLRLLERVEPGSEHDRRARAVLQRQTQQLARLVDDLVDITRIGRGKLEIARARLELRELVRRVCEDQRSVYDERGVTLAFVEASEPLWVDGDASRLAQIAGNLLNNALKFTSPGGRVDVTVARQGTRGEVRVRDTGQGIATADLGRIFEPYVQAEGQGTQGRSGLGVGLALARELARRHGGDVLASSAGLGHGAEFVLALPLAPPLETAPNAPEAAPSASPLSILIVDDNEDGAETLAALLSLHGHETRVVTTGTAAVREALAMRPRVLVCDIGLPDITGYDVLRCIRSAPTSRTLFAIALTGYVQPQDREEARRAGFDEHMPKPPDVEELVGVLKRVAATEATGGAT
jgi:PAS domain S-box-containing protein